MAISAGDAIWTIDANLKPLDKALNQGDARVKKSMGGFEKHGRKVGIAFTAMGAGIIAVTKNIVTSNNEFGKGLANIATLGVEDLAAMEEGVKSLAMEFGVGLDDGVKAAYDTLSAGLPEGSAIEVLQLAATGARAGVGELNDALDLGTSIFNAYGLKSADATTTVANFEQVMGEAVTAVKFGKTTIADLGGAVGKAAATFSEAGVSTKELFANVAALTTTGLKASEAITGLRTAVSSSMKPNEAAAAITKELKIEFGAAALKSKGLNKFLGDLVKTVKEGNPGMIARRNALEAEVSRLESLSKRTKEQNAAMKAAKKEIQGLSKVGSNYVGTLAQIFGSMEATNAVLTVTGSKADIVADAMSDMANASENLAEMFRLQVENDPSFTWEKLAGVLQVIRDDIGDALLPAMQALALMLLDTTKAVRGWIKENPGLTAGIAQMVVGAGALMAVLGPILLILPGLIAAFGLLSPPVLAIGAAVAAAAILIATNWDTIVELATSFMAAWAGVWDSVKAIVSNWWDAVSAQFEIVWAVASTIFEGIVAVVRGAFEGISGALNDIFGVTSDFTGETASTLEWFSEMFKLYWEGIAAVIVPVSEWMKEHMDTITAVVKFGVTAILTPIKLMATVIKFQWDLITGIFETAKALWESFWGALPGWVQAVISPLGKAFDLLTEATKKSGDERQAAAEESSRKFEEIEKSNVETAAAFQQEAIANEAAAADETAAIREDSSALTLAGISEALAEQAAATATGHEGVNKAVQLALDSMSDSQLEAWEGAQDLVESSVDGIQAAVNEMTDEQLEAWETMEDIIEGASTTTVQTYQEAMAEFTAANAGMTTSTLTKTQSWASGMISLAKSVRDAFADLPTGGGGGDDGNTQGFATGGIVPGPAGGFREVRVGELGPEKVVLPSGSRIHSAAETSAMDAGGGGMAFNFSGPITVRQQSDIKSVAVELYAEIQSGMRGRGVQFG